MTYYSKEASPLSVKSATTVESQHQEMESDRVQLHELASNMIDLLRGDGDDYQSCRSIRVIRMGELVESTPLYTADDEPESSLPSYRNAAYFVTSESSALLARYTYAEMIRTLSTEAKFLALTSRCTPRGSSMIARRTVIWESVSEIPELSAREKAHAVI